MEPDSSSDPADQDDGRERGEARKGTPSADGVAPTASAAAEPTALVAAKPSPVIGPKTPPGPGTSLAIVAQHFDVPSTFATDLEQISAKIRNEYWDYEVNVNSYWAVRAMLDGLASRIAGQIVKDAPLEAPPPPWLKRYWDLKGGWGKEIRERQFYLSRFIKESGLGTKDAPKVLKILPTEAMQVKIRKALEPWQVNPDEAGVLQIAERVVQAIQKRRLMVMVLDVDPFAGIAFGGGKSQLLFQLLYWVFWLLSQERDVDYPYDARKDTVYRQDRGRMQRLLNESYEVPIGVDEINQFFDMWEWSNPANKSIVHQVEMYRKVGRPIVGACSQIWILNKRFREIIVTHRLSVTKWDDTNYVGEATLFEKWGPPAAQDEKENRWGRSVLPIKFSGLTSRQFRFYSKIADTARDLELNERTLDDHLKENPEWLSELQDPVPETGKSAIRLRPEIAAGT